MYYEAIYKGKTLPCIFLHIIEYNLIGDNVNVAVINLKDLGKYAVKVIILIGIMLFLSNIFWKTSDNKLKKLTVKDLNTSVILSHGTAILSPEEKIRIHKNTRNLMDLQLAILTDFKSSEPKKNEEDNKIVAVEEQVEQDSPKQEINLPIIEKTAVTEINSDKNLAENYNLESNNVKIRNKTDYELTSDILALDVTIENPKDILIYHTHTCESYTPSENYNYTMTGNYRTTDSNYNMIRVGEELTKYLTEKGFNVIHDGTYHDYPSYSGSYDRSYKTATDILYDKNIDLVIDLHRDAVGNGDTYGPTVKINGERVAQIMFVIGTDGGGLEHPNWAQNLKIAIKIQSKANEMYPGLFRPIILTNSRYNQHIAKGACIIEVGATANTLDECLLSMQCLANVLEEL